MDRIPRRDKERLMRENEIMDAAEKIFARSGYEKTSVDEIAAESQYTRKTIYQHFKNKEDLYMAIVVKGFKQLLFCIRQEKKDADCGFEKLRKMGMAYYQFYQRHPDTFRLMSLVGHIKSKEENTENHKEFDNINDMIVEEIAHAINEGKQDGSVRNDLDTTMAIFAAQFMITGFFYQLSITGKTFTQHFSINLNEFVDFSMGLLTDLFKA